MKLQLFIKTVLKLITHLADRAPQWIGGHSGQGLGTEEVAGGATRAVEGGGAVVGRYAVKVGGIMGGKDQKRENDESGSGSRGVRDPEQKVVAAALNAGSAASTDTGNDGKSDETTP